MIKLIIKSVLILLLVSCATHQGSYARKSIPALPIFKLTDKSTDSEKLSAYAESLNLMIIYANQLEVELTNEHSENIILSSQLRAHREIDQNSKYFDRHNFKLIQHDKLDKVSKSGRSCANKRRLR